MFIMNMVFLMCLVATLSFLLLTYMYICTLSKNHNIKYREYSSTFQQSHVVGIFNICLNRYNLTIYNNEVTVEDLISFINELLTNQGHYISPKVDEDIVNIFRYLDTNNITVRVDAGQISRPRVLVLASYHSGSTFTGSIFASNKDVFYMFEPLQFMTDISDIEAWQHLRRHQCNISGNLMEVLNCRFHGMFHRTEEKFSKAAIYRGQYFNSIFTKQVGLVAYGNENYSRVAYIMEDICRNQFQATVAKVIRAESLVSVLPLILSGVKVILLVRDPKGLAYSRFAVMNPIPELLLSRNMESECDKTSRNLRFLQKAAEIKSLNGILKNSLRVLRYEDLALDPLNTSYSMFKFAGIEVTSDVKDWINASTSATNEDTDSRYLVRKWKHGLSESNLEVIDTVCKETMQILHYDQLTDDYETKVSNMPYMM